MEIFRNVKVLEHDIFNRRFKDPIMYRFVYNIKLFLKYINNSKNSS